jgi:hypothetical protein
MSFNFYNQFNTNNGQCDSSTDLSCASGKSQKPNKLSAPEKGIVLAGMGIDLNAV